MQQAFPVLLLTLNQMSCRLYDIGRCCNREALMNITITDRAALIEAIRTDALANCEDVQTYWLREALPGDDLSWSSRYISQGQYWLLRDVVEAWAAGGSYDTDWWVGGGEWGEQVHARAWRGAAPQDELAHDAASLTDEALEPVWDQWSAEWQEGRAAARLRWEELREREDDALRRRGSAHHRSGCGMGRRVGRPGRAQLAVLASD
jgi:hypothetical protein